ncbi:MAG: hypothetical protein EA398_07100 [Deltaproteobacteria bacterium]|nr:MAG: hypothetical protein EA398_07100 [Deltaproteobacteria bacterium]
MTVSLLVQLFLISLAVMAIAVFRLPRSTHTDLDPWGPPMEGLTARAQGLLTHNPAQTTWATDRTENGIHITAATRSREYASGNPHARHSTTLRTLVVDIEVDIGTPLPFFTFEALRAGIDPLTEPSSLLRDLGLPPGYGVATDDPYAVTALLIHPAVVEPFGRLLQACRDFDHVIIGARGNALTCRELSPVPAQAAAEPLLMAMSALGAALRHAIGHPQPGPPAHARSLEAQESSAPEPAATDDAPTTAAAATTTREPTAQPTKPTDAPVMPPGAPPTFEPDTPPPLPEELA